MHSVTVKLTPEQHASILDEQKRHILSGKVVKLTDASASKIVTRALVYSLQQPDSVKDQIFLS